MSPLGRAAVAYAQKLGWPVFSCAAGGKAPALAGGRGCLDATIDPAVIARWWQAMPSANVGLAMGAAAGVWALDVDAKHDGEEALLDLIREHGPLPETVEQLTPGGRHLLFRYDERVGNRVGFGRGLDTRSQGGYIVGAPSLHPSGRRYVWEVDHPPLDMEPAAAPEWLVALVAQPAGAAVAADRPSDWLMELCEPVPEGRRNATATRLAGYLLRRYAEPCLVLVLVQAWNRRHCRPPLNDAEVEGLVENIAGRELRRRGYAA